MSERSGFAHGVPCWIETWQPDAEAAANFYVQLFDWEAEETNADAPGQFLICRLRGRDVVAIGSPIPEGAPRTPVWTTHIWVDDAVDAAAKAEAAGGSVVWGPDESLDGGRLAIVADPAGAAFGVWQPGAHRGAQLVNEPGAWSMSALNARDAEGAKAFYGSVFGWEADTFELGGAEVTLFRLPGYVGGEPQQPVPRDLVATMAPLPDDSGADASPHWSVDFWVDDVDATAAAATRNGGKVLAEPYDLPDVGMRQAVLADPQGAAFSVTKVNVPAARGS